MEMSENELVEKINAESKVLQNLVFANAITPIENPMKIKATRRYIAQLHTELRRREMLKIKELYFNHIKAAGHPENYKPSQSEFVKVIKQIEKENKLDITKKFIATFGKEIKVKEFLS